MKVINFYTRNGCLLCDDAKMMLQLFQDDWGFIIHEIDIEQSEQLTERYGLSIPVIEIDGQIIQEGIIDPSVIETYLKK